MSDALPSRPSADRNLLFGILALQLDFISRDALIAAMNAWVLDKAKPLGQILVEQKALRPDQRDALTVLVGMHLECHHDDPEKSLAALAVPPPLTQDLRSLADADVQATVAYLANPSGTESTAELAATKPLKLGISGLRYQLLRPHGKGGIGEVFVALDQELNREVALKEIRTEHADDPYSRGRFVREAEITGGLEHPGIVPVYGLGQYCDGRPFYAMRFIQGETLKDAIVRYHKLLASGGRQPPDVAKNRRVDAPRSPEFALRALLTRFVAVCNTIAYAHSRGVIHRDIKPANIMLGRYGETLIVDWGLAKALSDSPAGCATDELSEPALVPHLVEFGETQAGTTLGTPAYMSPEQAAGRADLLGPASDIYSLGATLYTLLTGHAPIESKETGEALGKVRRGEWLAARQVRSDVPPALEAICHRAMALQPEDRYQTALELAADVEHWLADEPVAAWREPWTVRGRRWLGRRRTMVSTVAAALLVAFLGSLVGLFLLAAAEERERTAKQDQAEARRIAEDKQNEARNNLYIAQMNLIQKEYDAHNIDHVREILASWMPTEANPIDLRGFEWYYWHLRANRELLTLKGHTGWVSTVCFSPDGTRLASAGDDQTVRVWDSRTGEELLALKGHTKGVLGVCFSPDGTRLASASWDETIKIWDLTAWRERGVDPPVRTLTGHTKGVTSVCFNHDGTRLASASDDQTVRVWDLQAWRPEDVNPPALVLKGHTNRVQAVCFSPDGTHVASASYDQTVKVWDVRKGQVNDASRPVRTLTGHTKSVQGVCFSPDGTRIASASDDQTVKVWHTANGQEVLDLRGHTNGVLGVCFSPDSTRLASASWDQTVKVWDITSGRDLLTLEGHTQGVLSVCFNPEGSRLASAGWDRTIKVWDSTIGQELLALKGHTNRILSVCFNRDGSRLATGSDDQTAKLWDGATGQQLHTLKGHTNGVLGVCFSPDGKRLATASWDRTVKLWDLEALQRGDDDAQVITLKGHTAGVLTACFSPDGKQLASASHDQTVRIWDIQTVRLGENCPPVLVLKGHTSRVQGVCFSPDGKWLATASWDHTVKLWDLDAWRAGDVNPPVLTFNGHTAGVLTVCFSPDGKRLASAGYDQMVKVWDLKTYREGSANPPVLNLMGHTNWIEGLCFSPDGKRIASASRDQTVRMWDCTSGHEILTLRGLTDKALAVCFSPDGTRLASAGEDQTIQVAETRMISADTLRQRAIVERVHALFSRLLLKELVLREIRTDSWLSKADRPFALQVAQTHSEDPRQLYEAARIIVRTPGGKKEVYTLALRYAEAALQVAPGHGNYLNALGVAHYRLGNHAKALQALKKSEVANATKEGSQPRDLAFLAMTQHHLGQKDQAKATLARLREVMKQPRWARETEAQDFLREAGEVVESKSAGTDN